MDFKFDKLKLTPDEVGYWQGEIRLGRSFRKKNFFDDETNTGRAMECYKYFKGDHDILNSGLETPIVDNQIKPIVNTFIAALSDKVDVLVKMKKTPSLIPHQKEITKSVFSYFREELKFDWHDELCKFDAYITGLGVKTNGYNSEFDEISWKEKEKVKRKRRVGLGRGKGTKMIEEEVEGELVRRKEWITKEFPFNERHSPFMVIVDPRAKSAFPFNGKWICLEYDIPYHEVKANKNFKNTEDLAPSGAIGTDKDTIKWDDYKKSICHLYQIQISRKDGLYILTLAKGYDKPLYYIKYPWDIEGFLTRFLTLNDTIDEFYPQSDVEPLIPLQDEVNYIQSRILEAIYKFLPKIGVNSDFFKNEEEMLNVLEKGEIGDILINHGPVTPNQATQVLNFTLQLNDKLIVLQSLKQEMRLISGVTEAELTGRTDAKTATEANIGARGSFSRIVYRRNKIQKFLKEDSRIFKQIVVQACDWSLIVEITGIKETDPLTGEPVVSKWLRLNSIKEALKGEFELDLDLISTQQPNLELKRSQILLSANFLFSPVLEQKLATQGMKIDYVLGAREYLRTMDQWREAESLIIPMSQKEAQAFMQQQLMQSKAGQQMMATAPQGQGGAPQGEAQTSGEMVASVLGTAK